MADLTAIRTALALAINAGTGLRAEAQAKDQVSPPMALVLPGNPLITFADTMDGTVVIGLSVVLILSDAAPTEKVQRALDAYLGIGIGEEQSIAAAVALNGSLSGTVEWCVPVSVTTYGRIEWNGIEFFGAKLNFSAGAI
jgi:hypothetical protein